MERICREEIDGWPLRQPVALYPRLENITLGVVMSAVFGVQGGPELEPLHAAFSNMLAYRDKPVAAAMFNVMPRGSKPPKSFLKVIGAYDAEVYKAIESARQDPRLEERDDILAMLVRAHHDDGSATSDGRSATTSHAADPGPRLDRDRDVVGARAPRAPSRRRSSGCVPRRRPAARSTSTP